MDYSRLSETCSPYARALRPEAPAFVPLSSLPSIPPSPFPQALRPQAPIFLPRAQSPPKQVLPPVLPTVHRAVAEEEEELGPAPWEIFDCPHCDRSNGCEWMIACSGEHEALEWAHLSCVGLSAYDFPDGRDEAKWYCPGCRNAKTTPSDPDEDADEDEDEEDEGDFKGEEEAYTGDESHPSRKRKRVQNGVKTVPGGTARYLPPAKPTSVAEDEAAYQESEENSDDDYSSYSESERDRKRSRLQLKKRRKPVRGKAKRFTTAAKTLPPSHRRTGASGALPVPSPTEAKRAIGGKSGPGGVSVPASFIKGTTGAKAGPRGELLLGKHEGSPRQEEEVDVDRYTVDESSRDGRRRRRAQIFAIEAIEKGKGKRKRAEPTSTDEEELDSRSQARRKRPRASAAAIPFPPLPRPAAVRTRGRPSTSSARKNPPPAKDDGWTDSVSDMVAILVQERIDAGDHTEKKWRWIAAQLKLRHGIDKTHSAIKNYWGRNLRVRYNIDERRVAKPDKLVTGLQSKEDRRRARELAKWKKGQLVTDPISVDDDDDVVKEKTSADAEDVPADVQDSSSEEEEPLAAKYQQRKSLDKVSSATDNVTIVKRNRRNDEVDPDDEDDDEDAFRRVPKRHQRHHHA